MTLKKKSSQEIYLIMINDALFFFLVALYGIQFYVDTLVFSYPAKRYDGKRELALLFNKQKKLSFLVRITVNLTYPIAAFLVDISYITDENINLIIIIMFAATVGVLLAKPRYTKSGSACVSSGIKTGSYLYLFHFIGIPLSLIVAPEFPEYRATIIQLGVVLNTFSTIAQVWLVDNSISRLLKKDTIDEVKEQVYFVWKYRLISKVFGVLLLTLVILNIY